MLRQVLDDGKKNDAHFSRAHLASITPITISFAKAMLLNLTSSFHPTIIMLSQLSLSFFTTLLLSLSVPVPSVAEVIHYPPANTSISNLTEALHGTGRPGIFNSSSSSNYGEYNFCNMPHVRKQEYKKVLPKVSCQPRSHLLFGQARQLVL